MGMNRFPSLPFWIALAITPTACGTNSSVKNEHAATAPVDRSGYSADPLDFIGVFFKSGKPENGERDMSSLSVTLGGAEESLRHDLRVISTFPSDMKFKVLGYTDSKECFAEECIHLSLRRAQLVHDWLINHGVPEDRLMQPEGYGSARPIKENTTETGRAMNRRAHISY